MADRIADPWGPRTPYGPSAGDGQWPVRVDTQLAEGLNESDVDSWVQSASLLHSNGDAMDIAVRDGRIDGVRGRADDRVNRGRLDVKDLYGWQANNSRDRLTRPLVRDGDRLEECDWDTAMGRVVDRSRELLAQPGGSGRRRGPDRPAMLAVDPRPTPVAQEADLHLAPRPGTNLALLNGILHEVIGNGWYDKEYVAAHTLGFEELASLVADYPPERVAEMCGVPAGQIRDAAAMLGTAQRLLSTVLQDFYQSNQATAASCQVTTCTCCAACSAAPAPACTR